jgi:hypothetical protein
VICQSFKFGCLDEEFGVHSVFHGLKARNSFQFLDRGCPHGSIDAAMILAVWFCTLLTVKI